MDEKSFVGELVSRETMERLELYVSLLLKWNSKINLVAPATLKEVWSRHILDSIQISDLSNSTDLWLDIGSGGGFPGLAVACLYPERTVTLIESDMRKCLFMQTVIRECSLSAQVINSRIEQAPEQNAAVLSARALAPLTVLLGFAERHLNPEGICLFMKGKSRAVELSNARRDWTFHVEEVQSQTSSDSAILQIQDIKRV